MRLLPFVLLIAPVFACGGGGAGDGSGVVDPPASQVANVSVLPGNLSLVAGGSGRLSATVRASNGSSLSGAVVAWTTSAPAVATVASDGTVTAVDGGTATITASAGGRSASATVTVEHAWDLSARGVPKLITASYIELSKIGRISRFRSGIGHDYSDDVEHCRSMKHYFMPRPDVDWGAVVVSSPLAGTIAEIQTETTFGSQLRIVSSAYPAFMVHLFHVKPDPAVVVGASVVAGQRLGTHIGSQTMSDVAIRVRVPNGTRFVSYFDAMTNAVFEPYLARGLSSRSAAIIPAAERDASPLSCAGEQFQDTGSVANWVELTG